MTIKPTSWTGFQRYDLPVRAAEINTEVRGSQRGADRMCAPIVVSAPAAFEFSSRVAVAGVAFFEQTGVLGAVFLDAAELGKVEKILMKNLAERAKRVSNS